MESSLARSSTGRTWCLKDVSAGPVGMWPDRPRSAAACGVLQADCEFRDCLMASLFRRACDHAVLAVLPLGADADRYNLKNFSNLVRSRHALKWKLCHTLVTPIRLARDLLGPPNKLRDRCPFDAALLPLPRI